MRILIVDDSLPMRRIVRRFVEDLADEIRECGDGAEALALYPEFRPDWVLMDIQMEKVDGIAATRQLKAEHPDAQILILTNYSDQHLKEQAEQAGASGYVLKENLLDVRWRLRTATSVTGTRVNPYYGIKSGL